MTPGEGIPIFEIPIYLMDENDYQKKWIDAHHKQAWEGARGETFLAMLKSFYRRRGIRTKDNSEKRIWKYNQIVGYIVIAVCNQDIEFNLYWPTDGEKPTNKIQYNRSRMLYFKNYGSQGSHFNYQLYDTPHKIKEKIKEFVKSIINYELKTGRYVDFLTFERILDCVDLDQLIKNCHKQDNAVESEKEVKLDELITKVIDIPLFESQQLISDGKVMILYQDPDCFHIEISKILEVNCIDSNKIISENDVIYIKENCAIIIKQINKRGKIQVEYINEKDFEMSLNNVKRINKKIIYI